MVLTQMIKIINVDIDMCYDIWYNGGIEKFTSCEQNIIRLGALHFIEKEEDFRKCLGEIEMDEEVKNKYLRKEDDDRTDTTYDTVDKHGFERTLRHCCR